MNTNNDYYKILGVLETASEEEIKKAYRKKAKMYHPDSANQLEEKEKKNGIRKINEAYNVLSNKEERKKYDLTRMSSTTKPNSRDSIFKEHLDRMFNPFGFSNKTGNFFYKGYTEEDYSEIMQIDKELQETLDALSNLEAERLHIFHLRLNLQKEYFQRKKEFEDKLKNTPDYHNAQNYILKISQKLSGKITKLFISTAEKENYEKYKQYLNEIEQAIVSKKTNIDKEEEREEEEYRKEENKINDKIDNVQKKVNSLRKKYQEHPQYSSYANYKLTLETSKQGEQNSNGTKKVG